MLPQLDLTHYSSQIFWLVVCAVVLIVAMRKVFIPRMNDIIKRREKAIVSGAEKLKELERVRDELMQKIQAQREEKAREYETMLNKENEKYNAVLTENLIKLKIGHYQMVKKLKEQYKEEITKITENGLQKADVLVNQALNKFTGLEAKK